MQNKINSDCILFTVMAIIIRLIANVYVLSLKFAIVIFFKTKHKIQFEIFL